MSRGPPPGATARPTDAPASGIGKSSGGLRQIEDVDRADRGAGRAVVDLAADAVGVEVEGVADALEGERPARVARLEPLARLAAGAATGPLAHDVDRVLQDGGHETELADVVPPRAGGRHVHDYFAKDVGYLVSDPDVDGVRRHGCPPFAAGYESGIEGGCCTPRAAAGKLSSYRRKWRLLCRDTTLGAGGVGLRDDD